MYLQSDRSLLLDTRGGCNPASMMTRPATVRNAALKYFVKIYCKRLKSTFLYLQYLPYMPRYAKSRTKLSETNTQFSIQEPNTPATTG